MDPQPKSQRRSKTVLGSGFQDLSTAGSGYYRMLYRSTVIFDLGQKPNELGQEMWIKIVLCQYSTRGKIIISSREHWFVRR